MRTDSRSALVWGLLLIVAGVAFLLNTLNLLPGNLLAWWPLLVAALGGWMLVQALARRRAAGGVVGGVVLLALGTFWLLESLGRVDDRLFLPVLLIALGGGLLLRTALGRR